MQTKVDPNNLLGNNKIFANSGEDLPLPSPSSTPHRVSQGIQSLLNSGGEGGSTTNNLDLGVSGEKIDEEYESQRNIFSISTGREAGLDLSRAGAGARPGEQLQGCVRMMFNEFCETTGLHGWKYLTRVSHTSHLQITDN